MEGIDRLCHDVLQKRELRSVDEDFARDIVTSVVDDEKALYDAWKEKNFHRKANEVKKLVKVCRRRLRDVYGVFFDNPISREKKEQILSEPITEDVIRDLMKRHVSTKERLQQYPYIYDHIFSYFSDVSSVLDLGCGYNPLSFCLLDNPPTVSFVDISDEETGFVSDILSRQGITNSFDTIDLSNPEEFEKLEKFSSIDVAFCFKLFDSLESKNRGISEKITNILARLIEKGIIVSFSTRSISGRNKIDADREWFWEHIETLNANIKTVETINEVFYLIRWKNR